MPRRGSPYGPAYERQRRALLAGRPVCWLCGEPGSDSADHQPPLSEHRHVEYTGCCVLRPAHLDCQLRSSTGGWHLAHARRRRGAVVEERVLPQPSRQWW